MQSPRAYLAITAVLAGALAGCDVEVSTGEEAEEQMEEMEERTDT